MTVSGDERKVTPSPPYPSPPSPPALVTQVVYCAVCLSQDGELMPAAAYLFGVSMCAECVLDVIRREAPVRESVEEILKGQ